MKKNGFLITIIGTFAVILITVIYALILTLTAKLTFGARFGDESVVALMSNSATYILIAFVVFEIVFLVWQFSSMSQQKMAKIERTPELSRPKGKFNKATKIAAIAAIIISFGMIVANSCIYTEVTKTSVCEKILVTTNEYTWEDVHRYTLSCDENGSLSYSVQMKNGKSFEFFASGNSCSDKFMDEFGSMLAFADYLSGEFDSSRQYIEKNIYGQNYIEQYYKSSPDTWKHIESIIN